MKNEVVPEPCDLLVLQVIQRTGTLNLKIEICKLFKKYVFYNSLDLLIFEHYMF